MSALFLAERIFELQNLDLDLSKFVLNVGPDLAGITLLITIFAGAFALRLGKSLRN
tara:strand:- start:217 stop:384 length:168 start_codon:yes stop_codon:yes gene_type:complete